MSEENTRVFREGDIIIREGDYGNEAYELIEGCVEVSCVNSDGEKVVIAKLKAPHIFGEMALIEEKPRSATIRALEPVVVKVTSKEEFRKSMHSDTEDNLPILRYMFERLRTQTEAFITLAKNAAIDTDDVLSPFTTSKNSQLKLIAETEEAKNSLGRESIRIDCLPYRIGRQTYENDVFSFNDLLLNDDEPYQISPNHLLITFQNGAFRVSDRGSRYGSLVNGRRIGLTNRKDVVKLGEGKNELILGDLYSQYQFSLLANYNDA